MYDVGVDDGIRARSKRLFGNSYMLEVCLTLSRVTDRATLSELVAENEVSSASLYSAPLKRLLALGLLIPTGRDGDDHRERWYAPAPSSLWTTADEIGAGRS